MGLLFTWSEISSKIQLYLFYISRKLWP